MVATLPQDTISSAPHTFLHGDVKPPNMFLLTGPGGQESVPAFFDWQYIAIGKSCCDIVFFLIEGYDIPMVKAPYSFMPACMCVCATSNI